NAILRGNGADPDKQVFVHAELTSEVIRLSVQDEGPGLDPARIAAGPSLPEELESENGRGLFIIKHLADQVGFSDQGNTIWMTLPRS
ncbi:MAG: ATP-binding protein, partial [Gemmatimonadales bacterium]